MRRWRDNLKLFVKTWISILGFACSFFVRVNKENWEKRVLIIFGGGVGDVIKRSIICKFIKNFLVDYQVYYLLPYEIDLPYSYQTFYFDYTRAKTDLIYFYSLVKRLKGIGFSKVIILLPFWENFLWILGKSLSPKVLYVPLETPPSNCEKFLNKIVSVLFYYSIKKNLKFIRVISIFEKKLPDNVFPSDVYKNAYFISQVIKDINPSLELNNIGLLSLSEIRTEIFVDIKEEKKFLEKIKKQFNLKENSYCVLGLGSSSSHKNWPVANFVKVAEYIKKTKNLEIMIVGSNESEKLIEEFKKLFKYHFINLVNKTTLKELCILIKNAKLVIGNDTSFIHIGIAFQKPIICPILNTQLGVDSLYGYEEINKWVYIKGKKDENSLKKITPEMVIEALEEVYNNIPQNFKLFFKNSYE